MKNESGKNLVQLMVGLLLAYLAQRLIDDAGKKL